MSTPQNSMSPFQKWLIILLSSFLLSTIAAIVIWSFGCCQQRGTCRNDLNHFGGGNGVPPIPRDSIMSKLVAIDSAAADERRFDSVSVHVLHSEPYQGVIIRNTDVLLSMGLNNLNLLKYTYCEKIRLKTKLGLTTGGKIHVYVHPVQVNRDHTFTDLRFNDQGFICYATGIPWVNPCKGCSLNATGPTPGDKPKVKPDGTAGVYVLDLNNPCPPCN